MFLRSSRQLSASFYDELPAQRADRRWKSSAPEVSLHAQSLLFAFGDDLAHFTPPLKPMRFTQKCGQFLVTAPAGMVARLMAPYIMLISRNASTGLDPSWFVICRCAPRNRPRRQLRNQTCVVPAISVVRRSLSCFGRLQAFMYVPRSCFKLPKRQHLVMPHPPPPQHCLISH